MTEDSSILMLLTVFNVFLFVEIMGADDDIGWGNKHPTDVTN